MARGGGRVGGGGGHHGGGGFHGGGGHHYGGSRHHYTSTSTHRTHYSSSGGGDADPRVIGFCCFFFGTICLIIAIVIPINMAAGEWIGDECNDIFSINRNEQAVCNPEDKDETWVAWYESSGEGYVNVYRATESLKKTTRSYTWKNYQIDLGSMRYDYFTIASSLGVKVQLDVECSSYSCDSLKAFWLSSSQYDSAVGYSFDDLRYPSIEGLFLGTKSLEGQMNDEMYYLVFSSRSGVSAKYNISIEYTVYDTKSLSAEKCKSDNTCKFKDLDDDEIIIMEFVSKSSSSTPYTLGSEPESVEIMTYEYDVDWSSVISAAVVPGLFAILLYLLAGFFLFKYLKKLGKLGKKIAKKVEKNASVSTSTTTVTVDPGKTVQPVVTPVQPVVTATPGYPAAQPYPAAAQPYPGTAQPYPAQAYPVDPNYPAGGYPGQPYPGQAVDPSPAYPASTVPPPTAPVAPM